jgi:hypothetical protein
MVGNIVVNAGALGLEGAAELTVRAYEQRFPRGR